MKVHKNTGMMGLRLILLMMNIGLIINIDANSIFNPCTETFCKPDPETNFNKWEYNNGRNTLYINLLEERSTPTAIVTINCANCDEENIPKVGSFEFGDSDFLKTKFEEITKTQYILQIENRQDYENQKQRRYIFPLILPQQQIKIWLDIIDIDDVNPSITIDQTPCIIEENSLNPTSCTFKIVDPDSSKVTYSIDEYSDTFIVQDDTSSPVKAVNKIARLHLLKQLNFETQPMYSFNVVATDDAGNEGSTLVIIKVKDVSDMPPVWMTIFATKTFNEHTSHVFNVLAKDGDIEVNAPISYKFKKGCHKEITVDEKSGEIKIGDIDRDFPEIADNTIKCTIIAYEDTIKGNGAETESDIIFIVQDINDNKPLITINEPEICMDEGTMKQFDKIFSVSDIDQGENAQYDVELVDDGKYAKAFQIIPPSGYRNWDFSMTVLDPNLLDYDEADWRNFELKIHSTDKGNPKLEDNKIIKVCLYNMNNNPPEFVTTDFTVNLPENTKINEKVIKILAKDKDTNDYVTYEITMGQDKFYYKEGANKNDPITVYTKNDNVFDYEKQNEVFFQITIHDNLNASAGIVHKVSQQVTINVGDINDEKPRITLLSSTTPEVEEHSKGFKIDDVFEAEDVDTTAKLEFSILWDETYAMKEGKKKTDKNLFENVFEIVPTFDTHDDGSPNYGKAKASLVVKEEKKLDWEEFEILYLKIKVEDTMQVENKPGEDFATMAIIIEDINDNPPKLNEPSDKLQVIEAADTDSYIGTVSATDKDGPGNDVILYELKPIKDTKDGLVKIDENTGEITVDEKGKIDADLPPTYYLYYNVIAKDPVIPEFYDTRELRIYIEDTNNKVPKLAKKLEPVDFKEGQISEKDKPIIKVEAIDEDREKPNNELIYEINGEANIELIDLFEIDDKGNVFVKKALLWTNKQESIEVNILVKDKKGLSGYNELKTKFILNIEDVDNNPPVLANKVNFETITEAEEKEKQFAVITATDDDKPCTPATEIQYKITKILNIIDDDTFNEITDQIFRIDTVAETTGDCIYSGNVVINENLVEHYGNFRISVTATNPGSGLHNEKDYDFKVTPYNFREPSITFPVNPKIILRSEQEIDSTLIQIDSNSLKDFKATDNQKDKFPMTFSLEAATPEDIFKFKSTGNSAAQLQLKQKPNPDDIFYTITVKARHSGTGNSNSDVEKVYKVYFVDVNQPPFFEKDATLAIQENDKDYCGDFPEAVDPKCSEARALREECTFPIFYHIMYETEFFEIRDPSKPNICVKKPLDYETETKYELTIIATNTADPPPPQAKNPLKLIIDVVDVNDNPPVFDTKLFSGSITSGLTLNSEILTVHATDVDTMDKILRYEIIKDSLEVSDTSLDSVKDPFKLDSTTGLIRNNFSPVADMKGHLSFNVNVFDTDDTHKDTAEVKISIITDINKVKFTFENKVESVKAKSLEVRDIFTKILEYDCTIDEINNKVEGSVVNENQTDVSTHFINPENNELVAGTDIDIKTSDLDVLANLRIRFEAIGLELNGYKKNTEQEIENMEGLLRIILIVVSVVLGSLIVILIIAFILRTRSLNKRLESMTTNIFGSTKSDLNRIGTSAPGTNKHAVEANPVWNTDLKHNTQFDSMSQTSGGSDLIGIEDNPEFQYNHHQSSRKDSINPMYQNNMANITFDHDDDDINSLPGSNI